jgi:hypothetical protein
VNPTEIDDALSSDSQIEPSAEFPARVMHAVHARATVRPYVRIGRTIWRAAGVASIGVAVPIMVALLERADLRPQEMAEIVRWLTFTLAGTLAVAWRITRKAV